ncbi:MAG: hypothetical protein JST85_09965 [Acidobacteria bacterium]|nr:hypothetical protein [Acidobacteriota bacterium]
MLWLLVSFLATFGAHTYGQVLVCDAEAFKNRDETQMSREYRLAYLKAINREKFEQLKSNSGGGGGFSIAGISLSGNASYEEFNQKREQELSREGFQQSEDEAIHYVRNSFDGPGAQAYNVCIAGLVAQQRGLFMWLLDTTDDGVTVKIHWRPTNPVTTRINVANAVQLRGSSTSLRNFPSVWPPDQEYQLILSRSKDQELRFVVNIAGSSASVFLPRKPNLPPRSPRPPERRCDSQVLASRGAAASHARLTDGIVGPNSPGQNSGNPAGQFWIELPQPEWIHHVVFHPFMNGTVGQGTIVGYDSRGNQTTLTKFESSRGSTPFTIYLDINKSKDIKKIITNTMSSNGRDWWAFTEVEVFVCR